jgi:hypothetical protein
MNGLAMIPPIYFFPVKRAERHDCLKMMTQWEVG